MASVKHKFVCGIPDDPDAAAAGEIVISNWNDEHSVSLAAADITALGFITSASVATADYVSSNSLSQVLATFTPSSKVAGTLGFAGVNYFLMSGNWTSYQALDLDIQAKGAPATTNLIISLYTDGGTTPFLTFTTNPIGSATASEVAASFRITGTRNQNAMKVIAPAYQMFAGVTNQAGQFATATFTASAINAIGIITGTGTTTTTMSSADIFLYGRGV